ncbi:hypothetical protein BD410DRAFT_523168 [Rickenella mellea]|uniref:F-box domain-containing protein n=1 Tax=Rickenella mellea TaxID=50990 RepID=A0A4Y7QGG9_9AGAM|nr:hypothetical protein BD410DRAFT_523168 [Rickenella mellea]
MTPSLPTELLRTILRYSSTVDVDFDAPVTHPVPESSWFVKFEKDNMDKLETKIAITRVCRRFRRIASDFRFEFVGIATANQALKLGEMLKKQSSNGVPGPREWVKFLFVRCPESNTRLITKILRLCRNLRGFSWNPTTSRTRFQNREAVQDEMIQNIPINVRYLHWNARVDQANTFAAFLHKASASLQIFYINRAMCNPTSQRPLMHVSFPSLTHLQVEDTYPFQPLVTWTMPSLLNLDLISHYSGFQPATLLSNVGTSLRVLRLGWPFRLGRPLLSHILKTCPNLEELHYRHFTFQRSESSIWVSDATHLNLKKVGVHAVRAVADVALSELRIYFGPISKSRFPSLDTIIVVADSGSPLIPHNAYLLMTRDSEDFLSAKVTVVTTM